MRYGKPCPKLIAIFLGYPALYYLYNLKVISHLIQNNMGGVETALKV